jgi:hypothetical protein
MVRSVAVLCVCFLVAGCNAAQTNSPAAQATKPAPVRDTSQPSQAQVAARNAWLACLNDTSRSHARIGRSSAADYALTACQQEESALVARLSEDPSLTPTTARAGLQRVKADWKREYMRRG